MERKIQGLITCGVKTVVSLMEADEVDHDGLPFVSYVGHFLELGGNRWINLPIPDVSTVSPRVMCSYLDTIHEALKNDPVFIHCWGGRGRTGTTIGCFLVDSGIVTGNEALRVIKRARQLYKDPKAAFPAPETKAQIQMVKSWIPRNPGLYDSSEWNSQLQFVRSLLKKGVKIVKR